VNYVICLPASRACPTLSPEAGSFYKWAGSDCSSRWARPFSAACWGVVPTPAQLADLGFPRQELGSGPDLPQGLAQGQAPDCWLNTGSLVPSWPIAILPCDSVYRRNWTSAQRCRRFWASLSATPTSLRAPRNMRRLRVGKVSAGEQPR
jgi:hypothetical protein